MSRSSCPATQTSFPRPTAGFAEKLHLFFAGLTIVEPAALALYAENARVRDGSRHWLM
jgi:hypothetical protein